MENEKNTLKENVPMNVKGKEENKVIFFSIPKKKRFSRQPTNLLLCRKYARFDNTRQKKHPLTE